jgi:CRP/FNR family cyclic AMP-dependent transcriptional regulator
MQEMLALADGFPTRTLAAGEVLLVDGHPVPELYILLEGTLSVAKGGVAIATITEPGACVGETSLLLGVPATADVAAATSAQLAVIDDARALLETNPTLPIALAQMLAVRLQAMTTYLADLKHQYADHEGGLGMVDVVLGTLMQTSATRTQLGSDRDPDPEY